MLHTVKVYWEKNSKEVFADNKYSRAHTWLFDGGTEVPASASPHNVPLPMSVESAVDPEEAFVASLSSCHMLWFLSIAASKRFTIESYEDNAEGVLEKIEEGKQAMTSVTLKPRIRFSGNSIPSRDEIDKMHHLAHKNCYIANSVKTIITVVQV